MEAGQREEEDQLGSTHSHLSAQRAGHRLHHSIASFDDTYPYDPAPGYSFLRADGRHRHDLDLDSDFEPGSVSSTHARPAHPARPVSFATHSLAAAPDASLATDGHAFGAVIPDDFYRYQGLQPPNNLVPSPAGTGYMATSISRPRGREDPSSLRSNANGTTPKHPTLPASRYGLRPSVRSVSSPIDDRPGAAPVKPATSSTSVRDKIKKFDQNATSSTPRAAGRTAIAGRTNRDAMLASAAVPAKASAAGNTQTPYSTFRTPATRELTPESNSGPISRTQRPKFAIEDQPSNNSQSFASRIAKPRTPVVGNEQASKSLTNLPPSPHARPSSSDSPTSPSSQGLLFGEILPQQRGTLAVGYGIEGVRPRRTSESNLQVPRTPHQRTLSDPDVEPSSPTDWYRGGVTGQMNGYQAQPQAPQSSKIQTRAHAASKPSPIARKPPQTRPIAETLSQTPPLSPSRLPISVLKLSSPTGSNSSPSSTRSNSPSTHKRPTTNGKVSRTGTPTGRAKTPTSRAKTPTNRAKTPTGRAKTPTQSSSAPSRKPAPQALISPSSTNRLNAFISAPSPKLSPPLRSSRPRQPVSTATTASSRMRAVDRPKSPQNGASKSAPRSEESSRPRRIAVGPIDFEQRREHIKLAYSKSIRESQAREARQQAAERRRREMEAAAKAKAAATAATNSRTNLETVKDVQESDAAQLPPRLSIPTDGQHTVPHGEDPELPLDSPTLGIPGSFPALSPPLYRDEVPQSAISAATETTEFDNETQTHPPQQAQSPNDDVGTNIDTSSKDRASVVRPKAEYQYPFEDEPAPDDQVSIKISLDAASPQKPLEPTPTRGDYGAPFVPGGFRDDYDSVPSTQTSYETTVTILRQESTHSSFPESQQETIPFPTIRDYDDEPDYRAKLDVDPTRMHLVSSRDEDTTTDECGEETDGPDRAGGFYTSHLRDNFSFRPASTCDSSETGALDDLHQTTFESHQTGDTSNSLMVPSLMSPAKRSSQQSTWTDFSVESSDPSDHAGRTSTANQPFPLQEQSSMFNAESRFRAHGQEPITERIHYSPEISPLDVTDSPSDPIASIHQLPELDTGDGFSIPYLTKRASQSLSFIPFPDHEPPQVPRPGSAVAREPRREPSNGYWDHASSVTVHSRRGSDDFTHVTSTPHSDRVSISTADHSLGGITPADSDRKLSSAADSIKDGTTGKERHRLLQRRNVMKELIDTEAVFVRDMNIVEEIYKGTAEACPRLDSKTIKLIFRNTDEIIAFHTAFLTELKDAVAVVYATQGRRSPVAKEDSSLTESTASTGAQQAHSVELDDTKDRTTSIGPVFKLNIDKMRAAHEGFLRSSDHAAKRLIQIQQDPTVKVWLNECNEVAKDLTAAWDLDSLLIKPMQRITKYPNLIITLLQHTPQDHPDRPALVSAKEMLETAIIEINKTKKNFELVGQIVGRKRKESDVKAGFARAFGKRVDKLQASSNRPSEDAVYLKLHEKFGDDYLRLQVVLRDVEFYTRQVSAYVHEFLQYLSSMELVMRLQPGSYPELESKWVQFNVSMRDIEKVALEQHLSQVRKHVIEPFELVIKAYGNPSLAMKKRAKRRLDYEKSEQLKKSGKSLDSKMKEQVEQYDALNETLKKELPKLSALTEKIGNICLGNFVSIQASWYKMWKEKVKVVLGPSSPDVPEIRDIISTFQSDFKFAQEGLGTIGLLNPAYRGRTSQSTTVSGLSAEDAVPVPKVRPRPPELVSRDRSLTLDIAPSLPTPDFVRRHSGQFTLSPAATLPSPHTYYYRDYYAGINNQQRPGTGSPNATEIQNGQRSAAPPGPVRPGTGRSYDSNGAPRQSSESNAQNKRDSNSTYGSNYPSQDNRRFSGLFHSALPLDNTEESQRSSRASSRERNPTAGGYNILWLAASLFEFNIETTKHEAGYPYLIYQAGEIFDVIAEKGELWLAKNQDDPDDQVGWIWSKHFAKLADS